MSAGYVGVSVFFTAQRAYKSYKYQKIWGDTIPLTSAPTQIFQGDASIPSPGIAARAYNQNSNRKQLVKPGFQPAVRNARRFIV